MICFTVSVIKVAGINGAKQTSNLIPLCHQLNMDCVSLEITPNKKDYSFLIKSQVTYEGKTGVEMEALSAVTIAGLTFYDMCKALSHDIVLTDIKMLEKHPLGSQAFVPMKETVFLVMVAPKGDKPDLNKIKAFIVPKGMGIN